MSLVAEPEIEMTPRTATRGRGASSFVEWLLVGGATLFLFPLSWWARSVWGLDEAELAVGFLFFHAAFVLNDPHFCVTYLLFYEDARRRALGAEVPRAQRARWIFAGVVVPVVLVAWSLGAIAIGSAQALGWMVQLMFLLVGWHYVKQGFGVLTVLSARRGVRFGELERRAILAHCYAAWAYAWSSPSTEDGDLVHKGVVFWAPGRPAWLELVSGVALALSVLVVIAALARKWQRERALPAGPLVAFVITVWAWTVWANLDPLVQYAVPALHSLQYLYFVWLLGRGQAREAEQASPFGPSARTRLALLAAGGVALGWLMLRGAPAFLDGLRDAASIDDPLGATPFFAAFFVVVNLHHYAMDFVIWRRESPAARHLTAA